MKKNLFFMIPLLLFVFMGCEEVVQPDDPNDPNQDGNDTTIVDPDPIPTPSDTMPLLSPDSQKDLLVSVGEDLINIFNLFLGVLSSYSSLS